MATVDAVRRIARAAAEARQAGHDGYFNVQHFDLTETGLCLKFVRQCEEAAAGQQAHDWRFDTRFAIWADYKMRRARLQVSDPEVADVVCFNAGKSEDDTPGHIGIYLGGRLVAENTSCGTRGKPRAAGTKITTLEEIGASRAMFFQTVPLSQTLVIGPDGRVITCAPQWVGQSITVAAAPLLTALGLPANNPAVHHDTGRAFLRELEDFTSPWGFFYRERTQGPRVYVQRVG